MSRLTILHLGDLLNTRQVALCLSALWEDDGNGIEKQVLGSEDRGNYVLNTELWRIKAFRDEPTEIRAAYNKQGHYIGDEKTAKFLCEEMGITPEINDPKHRVCSIGYSDKDKKWYGWSHRAIKGFALGDQGKQFFPDKEVTGKVAESEEDCKEFARRFAESVSASKPRIEHRTYMADRGAKLQSGPKVLIMRRPDQFQISTHQGEPCVIKDGVVYLVPKKLMPELRRRSELRKPIDDHKDRVMFLDVNGLDIEQALVKNLKLKDKEGAKHGFNNGTVYGMFPVRFKAGQAFAYYKLTPYFVGLSIQAPPTFDVRGDKLLPELYKQAEKFAKYLKNKYGIKIGKFNATSATVANVGSPDGSPFTGRTYSYGANWSMIMTSSSSSTELLPALTKSLPTLALVRAMDHFQAEKTRLDRLLRDAQRSGDREEARDLEQSKEQCKDMHTRIKEILELSSPQSRAHLTTEESAKRMTKAKELYVALREEYLSTV